MLDHQVVQVNNDLQRCNIFFFLGWTALQNSIRIYFHQGEAIILHSKDWESEDMSEISQRLKAVTNGAPTQEFTLRRNQLGQLGFHVQHDGLITEVENFGYAWQTGLRYLCTILTTYSFSCDCFKVDNNHGREIDASKDRRKSIICIDIAQSTIIIVQFLCIELNSCIYDLYLKIGITI